MFEGTMWRKVGLSGVGWVFGLLLTISVQIGRF